MSKKFQLKSHLLTIASCVLITTLGIIFLANASSGTTMIGENISTNDLSIMGNVTSGTWQGTAVTTQYGGTGQDFSGSTGILKLISGTASMVTDNSANWDTAYTYSQVGHLPLTGGTLSSDLTIQETGDAKLTIYSNTNSSVEDSKLFIIQKGTIPAELFSVDEDGDVVIANDLSVNNDLSVIGNVTSGTWQGTPIATEYGGTGIDWSAVAANSIPYFSDIGTLDTVSPGTDGLFLMSKGPGSAPTWDNVSRSATFVICANDSLNKTQCDYVCDGENDQVEINAAIDALPNGGGKILLLEGDYVGSKIQIQQSNVVLCGMGKSSVYTLATGSNTDVVEVGDGSTAFSGIRISNLKIDGNNATGTGAKYGIIFNKNITQSIIYDIEVINVSGEAGICIDGSDNNTIDSCQVYGNDVRGILLKLDSNDNIISKNNSYLNGSSGIYLHTGVGLPTDRNLIYGNVVNNNGHGGIVLNGNSGSCCHNVILANTCNENMDGVGGIHIAYVNSKYNSIVGNTCNDNTGNGIGLYKASYNTINGNTCKGNMLYHGIYLQVDCSHNIVSNNILQGNWWGLGLHESMYNIIDSNQIVSNSYDGIRCMSNSDYCKLSNNNILGNCVLSSSYDGIVLDSHNCVLHHNTYIADSKQRYGLWIKTGADNNLIHDEIFQTGGITANLYDEGSNNSIKECLGHITENSGSASVSNEDTIAHGLASTPTYINLTTSNADHIASVTSVDGTDITIGLQDHDGSAVGIAETVYWEAEMR